MRHVRSAALALLILAPAFASACGGGQTEPKTPEPAATTTTPPAAAGTPPSSLAPSKPWKEMSLSEKKAHMKTAVMPKMTETFQSFDKSKFADVTCITCHGSGAKNGNFVMPNPALPKLTAEGGFAKHKKDKPEMTKFMMERVMPDMIQLLGAKPYDPQTHQGLGCTACHTMEK
jgi:hypothetical protein